LVNEKGEWELSRLARIVRKEVLYKLNAEIPPHKEASLDKKVWGKESSGESQ